MSTAAIVWVIVFCVSFGVALYAFLGYPLLMLLVTRFKKESALNAKKSAPRAGEDESESTPYAPRVTVVVAAYNERENIITTLKTLVTQDYPADRFDIVVFSDGSTDGTDELVRSFARARNGTSDGPTISLVRFEGRIGKTECQNRTVEQLNARTTRPEVVAFSDGNILWQPTALQRLVAPFTDARVAATTGALHLVRPNGDELARATGDMHLEHANEGLFRRFDHIIKKGESRVLSTVGVNGPIYAVRRTSYIRLQPKMVSDLVLPVLLVAQRRRVVFAADALGLEPASTSIWQEFRRKRRLVTQGFVALPLLLRAAAPWRRPGLFTLLVSHKVLRWIGVELLAISFVATVVLVVLPSPVQPVFVALLVAQLAALFFAGLGLLFSDGPAILEALSFFVLTNVASLVAVVDYVRGRTATRWHTERSESR